MIYYVTNFHPLTYMINTKQKQKHKRDLFNISNVSPIYKGG